MRAERYALWQAWLDMLVDEVELADKQLTGVPRHDTDERTWMGARTAWAGKALALDRIRSQLDNIRGAVEAAYGPGEPDNG